MPRIEIRIPLTEKMDSGRLKKLLGELEKTDFLYSLRIDCTVEIQ